MNRRRLEVEPWRDAMLAVSGNLDERLYGGTVGHDAPGPDGIYGTADDTPGQPAATDHGVVTKLSFQATNRHRLVGFFGRSPISNNEFGASRFNPYETTQQYLSIPRQAKLEWQGVLNNRWVLQCVACRRRVLRLVWQPTGEHAAQPSESGDRIPNRDKLYPGRGLRRRTGCLTHRVARAIGQ